MKSPLFSSTCLSGCVRVVMWYTRAPVMVIIASILLARNGGEAQQCADLPSAMDVEAELETQVFNSSITCTAISTEQPPSGLVYYREAVAIVTYSIIDSNEGPVTHFVRLICFGNLWSMSQVYDGTPTPNPEVVVAREDCYQCGLGQGSDPNTLCLRKCACMVGMLAVCKQLCVYM